MPERDNNIFAYKLDFYYQAMAIYAVTLIAYAAVVGVARDSVAFVWKDQVVYLLAICTLAAAAGLAAGAISGRKIVIETDSIVFSSRFHRRRIGVNEIAWIRIGREKRVKVRGAYKVAKIKLRNRRRLLRVRPSLYRPEDGLIEALRALNLAVHKNSVGGAAA